MTYPDKISVKSVFGNYEVEFIKTFADAARPFMSSSVFVIDRKVWDIYGTDKLLCLSGSPIFLQNASEDSKTMESVMELVDFFHERKMTKSSRVVSIGGGITQEISCFASSIFLRGVEWFFFPTTLLASSDSCIGGKSGLNYRGVKNRLGTFHPPGGVFIDVSFFKSLSKYAYIDGFGEITKACLLNERYSEYFLNAKSRDITDLISKSLSVKKDIIEADELEKGARRLLNYGHTFGHALEAYTNNRISHGRAVLWGIDAANHVSFKKNLMSETEYLRIKRFLYNFFLDEEFKIENPRRLFNFINSDKKAFGSSVYFVLLKRAGAPLIVQLEINEDLYDIFEDFLNFNSIYFKAG